MTHDTGRSCWSQERPATSSHHSHLEPRMPETTDPQPDRRERYAQAIRETDGWVLDDGQHMIAAVMAVADAEQAELRRKLASSERIRENADFHLGQEMARRQLAEKETARLRAGRAAVLREAIDVAREEGHRLEAEQGIEVARGARSVAYLLRRLLAKDGPSRMAVEAPAPNRAGSETPCGPVPDACDAEAGEPCANHEREQAHAEGEHAFCGAECAARQPSLDGALRIVADWYASSEGRDVLVEDLAAAGYRLPDEEARSDR